jgi:hypothetical protein
MEGDMGLIFKDEVTSSEPLDMPPVNRRIAKNSVTGEDYIPGYVIGRGVNVGTETCIYSLEQVDGQPPMTAAQKAFGVLWYGDLKPDLILSSEVYMKKMVRRIIPNQRKAGMYGCNFGFFLNGAIWSYSEEVDCSEGWVFILNTKYPTAPHLNGCYKAMEE